MRHRPHAAGGIVPGRVLVAGDRHGNRYWALSVIHRVPQLLAGEERRLILHLGDFGISPDGEGRQYLTAVNTALGRVGARLWFVDGNHEDFTQLAQMASSAIARTGRFRSWTAFPICRADIAGTGTARSGLARGGGVSLDKAVRWDGRDWWPQEELTSAQEAAIIGGAMAEVMVCHDCRAAVPHALLRRRRGGARPTWRVMMRTAGGCSGSWTAGARPISCTGTCTALTSVRAISATGRSR